MRYSTFLLDLDHTLFNSDISETEAFAATLIAAGLETPGEHIAAYRVINLDLSVAIERGEITPTVVRNRRFERLVDELGLDADPGQMADHYVAGLVAHGELYSGAMGQSRRAAPANRRRLAALRRDGRDLRSTRLCRHSSIVTAPFSMTVRSASIVTMLRP